jgi:uncharacterized protein YdaU (DUF1376 family)
MPVFPDALIGDTTHLTMEEFGVYCMILFVTWRNNGQPLPDDDKRMARICRMSGKKWAAVRPAVADFFDLSEGVWRQKRLEKEWKYVCDQRAKQSEKGKKSAEARQKSKNSEGDNSPDRDQDNQDKPLINNETPSTVATQRLEPEGQPNVNPQPQPHTEEKMDRDKSLSSAPDGSGKRLSEHPDFEEWYRQYPLKKDRQDAAKLYAAARKKGASREDLMAGAMRYAAECAAKGTEKNFIRHPSTWLRKGSWHNEPDLLTPNNGNQNVHKLDLARTYQQQPDIRRSALVDDGFVDLDDFRARAY